MTQSDSACRRSDRVGSVVKWSYAATGLMPYSSVCRSTGVLKIDWSIGLGRNLFIYTTEIIMQCRVYRLVYKRSVDTDCTFYGWLSTLRVCCEVKLYERKKNNNWYNIHNNYLSYAHCSPCQMWFRSAVFGQNYITRKRIYTLALTRLSKIWFSAVSLSPGYKLFNFMNLYPFFATHCC